MTGSILASMTLELLYDLPLWLLLLLLIGLLLLGVMVGQALGGLTRRGLEGEATKRARDQSNLILGVMLSVNLNPILPVPGSHRVPPGRGGQILHGC